MTSSLALVQTHALGGFGDLTDEAMNFANRAVRAIRIESAWGPSYTIDSPFAPSPGPGAASVAGNFMKPKITFVMREGWGRDRSTAPYGDPGASKWPFVVAVGVALLAAGAIKITRR